MIKFLLKIVKPIRNFCHYVLYTRSMKTDMSELIATFSGKKVVIVANGPSLNHTEVEALIKDDVVLIGMNKIHMIYDRVSWRPHIVVAVNNIVINQSHNEIVNNNDLVLFPIKSITSTALHFLKNVKYFNMDLNKSFSKDFSSFCGGSSTVTGVALQLAYAMDARKVVIVGMDHSFKYQGKANDIQKVSETDPNHFDPNYFEKGKYWGVPDLEGSEQDYFMARAAFEQRGVDVVDATIDGKCRVFKRMNLDQAADFLEN